VIADKHNADKSSFISVMFRPATKSLPFLLHTLHYGLIF